ncbi:MAG TPA: glycosyltransferase [Gammaproteobacteria bacterium]|nr:glycosyltransferase [Gammaproteobacteria bacterium]
MEPEKKRNPAPGNRAEMPLGAPRMRKNILHLTFSLDVGGLETLLLALLKKLDRETFHPIVCTLSEHGALIGEFEQNGIEVITLPKKPGLDFRLMLRLTKLLRDRRIDLVHTHNFGAWLYGVCAGALSRTPVINTEHSNVPTHKKLQMLAEKPMAALSRFIICDSEAVQRQLGNQQNIPAWKLKLILNGVDVDAFSARERPEPLRQTLGLSDDTVVLGCVARLAPIKNHSGLLAAVGEIAEKTDTPFHLLIIGDGECREALEKEAKTRRIADRVSFLGKRRDIPELFSIIDIFVLASFMEGLPIALLEAMASGKPSIATDVGGNAEILGRDNRAGILIPPRNQEALCNALLALIDDEEQRLRLGKAARTLVEKRASLGRMVTQYQELYKACLA